MSPWADLTLSGESIGAKAAVDPALTREGLRRRAVGAGTVHTPRLVLRYSVLGVSART
jgi:hypothetical protein